MATFRFDGDVIEARPGDTVASALLRSGVRVVTHSPYLGRPRGVTAGGEEEAGALVQIDSGAGEPMRPATRVEACDGLVVRGIAGRGDLPDTPDTGRYDKANIHCELLVVGSGESGVLAAAAALAADPSARIVIVDELPPREGIPAGITYLSRTSMTGLFDDGYAVALERRTDHLGSAASANMARTRVWHIRAERTVLATGCFERPLAFCDNDRPGVMLAGSAARYATEFGISWAAAVVVSTNDSGLESAVALHDAGTPVAVVVDIRHGLSGSAVDALAARGIELRQGWSAIGTDADAEGVVAAVVIAPVSAQGAVESAGERIGADLCAVAGGWSPNVALWTHAGGKLLWDADVVAFVPAAGRSDITCVGTLATGVAGSDSAPAAFFGVIPDAEDHDGAARTFLDVARDATWRDLTRALGAGMTSVEHVKRYTTIGTAHDQGKTSGVLTIGLMAQLLNLSPDEVGTTTFRPPYVPVPFASLAGREVGHLVDPSRITQLHDWHVAQGAVFENVGQWLRPWYFPVAQGESMHDAVLRECRGVRTGVGIMDASTLGKIELVGPDVGEFLDRLYTNVMSTLKVGRARYGLMCGADGMVFDDGVVLRLADERWFVTTTTGGAARVLDWMEEWLQTEWPDLRVRTTSVTEQWSTIVVAGPQSRDVVAAVVSDLDVSRESFTNLSHRTATIAGVPGRVVRVSFSGELAFELMVPSWGARAAWEAVWAAGQPHGVVAYGTETMHVLRAEKGFIIVHQETDGTQTPFDLGMDWIVRADDAPDFIGRRSFSRVDTSRAGRKQLVGLLPVDPSFVVPEGAQLVKGDADLTATPVPMLGHVTSSYASAELERSFALALVAGGRDRTGETLLACFGEGQSAEVVISDPVFIDPQGARRDG